MRYTCRIILVVLVTSLLFGCGEAEPGRATINGQITFEGKPVNFGHIVFIPVDHSDGYYSQTTIINGKYSMSEHGPILGKNRVEVHGHRKKSEEKAPNIAGVRLDDSSQVMVVTEPYLPAKYNVGSELTVEIKAGKNENVDFNLE